MINHYAYENNDSEQRLAYFIKILVRIKASKKRISKKSKTKDFIELKRQRKKKKIFKKFSFVNLARKFSKYF